MRLAINTAHGRGRPTLLSAWVPPVGTWANMSLNVLESVNPCPANNCVWSGPTGGPSEIFKVWSGAVRAPEIRSVLLLGGGHLSYDGNECYRISEDTRLVSVHGTPAPYSGADIQADGEYPDGTPPPPHTYGWLGYLPSAWGGGELGSLLLPGIPGGSGVEQRMHAMDLATGSWSRFGTENLATYWGNSYGSMVRDDLRECYWIVPAVCARIAQMSKAGVMTLQHTNTNLNSGAESITCRIESLDILVCSDIGVDAQPSYKYLRCWEAAPQWNPITTSGTKGRYNLGFEYCPDTHSIYGYPGAGQNYVRKLTIPANLSDAWVWTDEILVSHDASSPSNASGDTNGHFRRFIWSETAHCFLWWESATTAVQAFRPAVAL